MKFRLKFCIISIVLYISFGSVSASVPEIFYSNYDVQDDRNVVVEMLTKIISTSEIEDEVPTEYFEKLNKSFESVIEYFPKQPDFKIIYEKCLQTSSKLSVSYDSNVFLLFEDSCYKELSSIIDEVNSSGTVKAVIKSIISEGRAPLNVTLDAKDSIDPSVDTIPEDNYFWYYRDVNAVDIVIGRGPVVNHTFDRPGRYEIHLTVRSSNRITKGVFDGEANTSITVSPKAANIVVYANSRKMDTEVKTKLDVEEAKRGVLLDGSPTSALGGRTIIEYRRKVESGGTFLREKKGKGDPEPYRLQLYEEGAYNVELSIKDNEGNNVSETYQLFVSDPIAKARINPSEGVTNQDYTFDASPSYSSEFKIKGYKWIIYDPNGVQIDTYETKKFTRSFRKAGVYTVRLTVTDQSDGVNDDQAKFIVKTSQPTAMFTYTPIMKWKYPSQFVFDASSSYDIDVVNKMETLEYSWTISNEPGRVIEKRYDNDKRILVTFNELGKYVITLRVDDNNGGVSEISKEIEIISTLRPEMTVSPRAVIWGNPISFNVKSEKSIADYVWDFGDGNQRKFKVSNITHTYDKIGNYQVNLKVTTNSDEQNELSYQVFVGERGYPIGVYEVGLNNGVKLFLDDVCTVKESGKDKMIDYPAYSVERYEKFEFNASESLNSKGTKTDLKIYLEPKNENLREKKADTFYFSELGCSYIDFTVEDEITNRLDRERVRFKVRNALPKISTVNIDFPQLGNDTGIGLNQNKGVDISQQDIDPLIVVVSVNGATDPDGQITQFAWYYYEKDNKDKLREVKITPYNINYAMFALPRISGKYVFGVKVVDNDDAEIRSEDVLGMGPMVVFPPGGDNPDVPFVSLKTKGNQTLADVGDEIEFELSSSILSDRKDFNTSKVIKYDFDGDGEYDLTTKKDNVKHVYDKPGDYRPKAKVIYRGYAGVGFADKLDIKKGLKPNFLYDVYGSKVILRDLSYGDVSTKKYCMHLKECKKDPYFTITRKDYFDFDYKDEGVKIIRLQIEDDFANTAQKIEKLLINKGEKGGFKVMTVPAIENQDGANQITIGENLDNSILFYVVNKKYKNCFVDFDITEDSDNDGNTSMDKDMDCNELRLHTYDTSSNFSVTTRIYYDNNGEETKEESEDSANGDEEFGTGDNGDSTGESETDGNSGVSNSGGLAYEDIDIIFLDADDSLSLEYKEYYEKITNFIKQLEGEDSNLLYLKTLLKSLKNSLGDQYAVDSICLQIIGWFDDNIGVINEELEQEILFTVRKFMKVPNLPKDDPVKDAKMNILTFISEGARAEVEKLFDNIESSDGNRDEIKDYMQQIFNIAIKEVEEGNLEETDLNLIKQEVCVVLEYYSINSSVCNQGCSADIDCEDGKICSSEGKCIADTVEAPSLFGTILKIVLIILGILFALFILLTVVFAIKAKRQQTEESPE